MAKSMDESCAPPAPRPEILVPQPSRSSSGLGAEAGDVLIELQIAFRRLLDAAGGDLEVPQSVARVLGLDKSLAWKICQIAREEDPFSWSRHLPGPAGLRIFFSALKKADANPEQLARGLRSVAAFDALVERHAGDRASFEVLLGEFTDRGRRERDERYRKLLFQGASYQWGVRTRTTWNASFLAPGGSGTLDHACLNSVVDFRRLRRSASWVVLRRRVTTDGGNARPGCLMEPVDAEAARRVGVPVLPRFSTNPLPALRRVEGSEDELQVELLEGAIGRSAEATCTFGTIHRGVGPRTRGSEDARGEHVVHVDTPSEQLVLDYFVHEALAFAHRPELRVYGELDGPIPASAEQGLRRELPHAEELEELGRAHELEDLPEVPRRAEAVRALFESTGWDPSRFLARRLVVRYPALSTALCLRYELPT